MFPMEVRGSRSLVCNGFKLSLNHHSNLDSKRIEVLSVFGVSDLICGFEIFRRLVVGGHDRITLKGTYQFFGREMGGLLKRRKLGSVYYYCFSDKGLNILKNSRV